MNPYDPPTEEGKRPTSRSRPDKPSLLSQIADRLSLLFAALFLSLVVAMISSCLADG